MIVPYRSHTGSDVHSDASRARANRVRDSRRTPRFAPSAPSRVSPARSECMSGSHSPPFCSLHAPAPPPGQDPQSQREGEGSVLGLVPHQLRGFLAQFRNMQIIGAAYDRCTGCSETVRSALLMTSNLNHG